MTTEGGTGGPASEGGVVDNDGASTGKSITSFGSGAVLVGSVAMSEKTFDISPGLAVYILSHSPACNFRNRSRISFCLRNLCANNLARMRVTSLADLVSDIASKPGVDDDSRARLGCSVASPFCGICHVAEVDEVSGPDGPGGRRENSFEVTSKLSGSDWKVESIAIGCD